MVSRVLLISTLSSIFCYFSCVAGDRAPYLVEDPNPTTEYRYVQKKIRLPVDHFSFALNDTFELRYLVNNDTQTGKYPPIFFYTGNEGDIEVFAKNSGFMWDIAPEFGAILIFAEHRYYGNSLPYGNKSFSEPKYTGYLNSQQAMADFIDVIEFIKTDYSLKKSPVIAFGGSYGGMLSAWIRMKYPHMIQGAIAASAPILSFPGSVDCQAFSRIVTADFKSVNPACSTLIRRSWNAITNVTSTADGKKWFSKNWGLCKPLNKTDDVDGVRDYMNEVYSTLAMLDYPYETNFLRPLAANPVSVFCSHLTNSSLEGKDLLLALNKAVQTYSNYTGKLSCMDTGDHTLDNLGGDKGWDYQACTEMVMPMCNDGINDMFEPSAWNFREYSDSCYKKFKVKPLENFACKTYGCKDISTATNIVFSNGLRDPWSSGGVFKNISKSALAVIIPEGAHHLDLRARNPNDPYSVIQARKVHVSSIKKWIKQYRDDRNSEFSI